MPAKTLGGAIASAGRVVNSRVAGRLGRINDVHKAAVEGHYKAEAQQRGHEHHMATLNRVHKLSGGGNIRMSTQDGYGGSHSVEYSKGESTGAKKSTEPAEKPAAEAPKEAKRQMPKTSSIGRGAFSRTQVPRGLRARSDAKKAAASTVASPSTSTGVDAPATPAPKRKVAGKSGAAKNATPKPPTDPAAAAAAKNSKKA